ncbi:conserved unknown protein [Ectocarpus siliculosus]|uniref:Uncharacterized protein n=1 Tax=Ectocarpus siliculosus TaxID=2880 RepID=D7FJB4_ECTSI|nr:conserved unknown protein [Ectocarpus siliculosus]|eukprot:CBJ29020.1 conserved unknown protein [Ectocarpus siliculosus]
MKARPDLNEGVTLLVSWALRLALQGPAHQGDAVAQQLLCVGDALDVLRPEAAARPRDAPRVGLIVQPYVWALALAMVDLANRRRKGIHRCFADKGSIASLETGHVAEAIEHEAYSFVELAAELFAAGLTGAGTRTGFGCSAAPLAPLFGACEMCETTVVKCHRFSSTPCRPELCVCTHGSSHHACIDPRATPISLPALTERPGENVVGARATCDSRTTQSASARWNLAAVDLLRRGEKFISSIGQAGIRDLLGLKRTVGSIDGCLPPSRRVLLKAINKPHLLVVSEGCAGTRSSGSCLAADGSQKRSEGRAILPRATTVCILTVGGRALCKHAVRAREGWWGECGGTEAEKNDHAEEVTLRLLAGATWVNLHVFGGGGKDGVLEIREESGYGARWSADGAVFRGFLEPHMKDGHEKGWRH